MPVFKGGHWWWRMAGQGWVAEDWLAFDHEGGYPWPPRPDLAAAGLVAYMDARDSSIWLMNADGSSPRVLVTRPHPDSYIIGFEWSPDGSRIAYDFSSWAPGEAPRRYTRVVGLDGSLVAEFPGLARPSWSPDGSRLAGWRYGSLPGGPGEYSYPVVVDVASGAEVRVGPDGMNFMNIAWSPDETSLAFSCLSSAYSGIGPDGQPSQEVRFDCGGDGLRVVAADGSWTRIVLPTSPETPDYFSELAWSPDGRSIAVSSHSEASGCRGIILLEAATGARTGCLPFPGEAVSGRCGGPSVGNSLAWTADGRQVLYEASYMEGQNGLFVRDLETGEQRLIAALGVWGISPSPDGRDVVFGAEGLLWVAPLDGATLTLLGEGVSPQWQPRP